MFQMLMILILSPSCKKQSHFMVRVLETPSSKSKAVYFITLKSQASAWNGSQTD